MAVRNFNDFGKTRGIDSRAVKTLQLKKQKKEEQDKRIKQQKISRELNSLRARLSVVDREIERLKVTERRSEAEITKTQRELAKELRDVVEVSKELREHESKISKLKNLLGTENSLVNKFRAMASGIGHSGASQAVSKLRSELSDIEKNISQMENKRRRIISEMAKEQEIARKESSSGQDHTKELEEHKSEVDKILVEMNAEQSIYNRLKGALAREEREAKTTESEFESVTQREKGSSSGVTSLERDKKRMEDRIEILNRELNK